MLRTHKIATIGAFLQSPLANFSFYSQLRARIRASSSGVSETRQRYTLSRGWWNVSLPGGSSKRRHGRLPYRDIGNVATRIFRATAWQMNPRQRRDLGPPKLTPRGCLLAFKHDVSPRSWRIKAPLGARGASTICCGTRVEITVRARSLITRYCRLIIYYNPRYTHHIRGFHLIYELRTRADTRLHVT